MGKKRMGAKHSGPANWIWKSVLLGGLIGAGLCALAAAMVMGGVIPQEGLIGAGLCALAAAMVMGGVIPQEGMMTAGRSTAMLGVIASGMICAGMAKERKVLWCAVGCGCTALCALLGNLLFVGQLRIPLLWFGAVGMAALLTMLCQLRSQKRKHRRK